MSNELYLNDTNLQDPIQDLKDPIQDPTQVKEEVPPGFFSTLRNPLELIFEESLPASLYQYATGNTKKVQAEKALKFLQTNPQLQNYWDNEIENDPVKKAIFAKNNMGTYLNMKAVYDDQVKKGMYLATSSTTSEEEFMEFNKCLN